MLVRADLGLFLCSLVSVVIGWFVVRRKWRRVVARRQEIRRLLALASEETARAEFEAVAVYTSYEEEPLVIALGSSPQRQLQHQCEVCFRPTTTRCKRCKAVHYCSGKCQIIHWRQGHKDECKPLASHQNIYVELLQKDDIQSGGSFNGIEEKLSTNPIAASSGEGFLSNPSHHLLSGKNDSKIEGSHDAKEMNENAKASVHSLSEEFSSSTVSSGTSISSTNNFDEPSRSDKLSTFNKEEMKAILTGQSISINPVLNATAFGLSNQSKSSCIDTDVHSKSSTSSYSSAPGSEKHPLSEPSASYSDFWGATVEPIGSKIDTHEFSDVNVQNSSSSCYSSSGGSNNHLNVLGIGRSTVMAGDPCFSSMSLNSTNETQSSERGKSDYLKSRGPMLLSCHMSSLTGGSHTSQDCNLKIEESKSSLSTANLEDKTSEMKGYIWNKDVAEVNSSQSLVPKLLKNEDDRISFSLNVVECRHSDSPTPKTSETNPCTSSCARKHAMDKQSVENGDTRVGAHFLMNRGCEQNASNGNHAPASRKVDELKASNYIRHCYLGPRAGTIGKYEGSFPYEHFVQLYNWNKVELLPCGLINCGNSCYANAVLQCLAFTPPLTAYFLTRLHSKTCGKKEWCFTCEFEGLVKKLKECKSPLSPAPVLSQMGRLGGNMGNGREEDAHEFLRYAIDAMQLVHLKEAGFKTPSPLDEDTTLVGLTFGGYLRSKIDCMKCGGKSEQHERIMDLTVEIGGISTLEEALQQFTRSEILDGDNKYHCGRCKSYEKAKKKLRILEAPNILTVALKRFQAGQYGKLNKAVKFPEILNLAPYMSGTSDKSPIYRLYGVIVHLDAMNATFSGHYVCYIKNNLGRWFKADDSNVREVEMEEVLLAGAYMLLYARCSPRYPRLRNSMAPREQRKVKSETCKSNSRARALNHEICNDCFYQHCQRYHLTGANSENDVLSENSSSIFSDAGSHSTENSNRESTSTDDSFDQILGDTGNNWNKPWRNSSDSDTSSPSSLYTRHSLLSDLDRYSSDMETSGSCVPSASSKVDRNDFQASRSKHAAISTENGRRPSSCPDSHKKLLGSSSTSSYWKNDSYSVGGNDLGKNVHLRRSIQ